MNCYNQQHGFYCGVDLHASAMYVCVLDREGNKVFQRNLKTSPEAFLRAIQPFLPDVVVGVECVFLWYWLADLCREKNIPFVVGHALYMKSIHGQKAGSDEIDSEKLANLLRSGYFPLAYAYPREMRATRDLMRRRMYLSRKRSECLAHVVNTNSQYNLAPLPGEASTKGDRETILAHFPDPDVRESIALDLDLIEVYDQRLSRVETYITRRAKAHDPDTYNRLRSVYGIGRILALVLLYEIQDIHRFPTVQDFVSYARLVKCVRTSAGKVKGIGGNKIGNVYLKWAFSEAAVLFLRGNEKAKKWHARMQKKHGKGKALSILARKLGQIVYLMLRRKEAFDATRFLNN
jgi:transposase